MNAFPSTGIYTGSTTAGLKLRRCPVPEKGGCELFGEECDGEGEKL